MSARRRSSRCGSGAARRTRAPCRRSDLRAYERREPLDAFVDLQLADEAERQAQVLAAAAVGIEERARDDADAVFDRAPRELHRADPGRKREPREEPALRHRPVRTFRHRTVERGEHALAFAPVEPARRDELLLDPTPAHVLLEQTLPECARALVGRLLRVHELRADLSGSDGPAEAYAGKQRLRRRARLHDDVPRELPQARP